MNIKFMISGLVIAVVLGAGMIVGEKVLDAGSIVTNAVAKTACSCVFVAERSLEACLADTPPGFDWASTSVDREEKAVHTSIYGVVWGTARFQGALGCSLE